MSHTEIMENWFLKSPDANQGLPYFKIEREDHSLATLEDRLGAKVEVINQAVDILYAGI